MRRLSLKSTDFGVDPSKKSTYSTTFGIDPYLSALRSPVGIRTPTRWTKITCATITPPGSGSKEMEMIGFEPTTPTMPLWCSSNWATSPKKYSTNTVAIFPRSMIFLLFSRNAAFVFYTWIANWRISRCRAILIMRGVYVWAQKNRRTNVRWQSDSLSIREVCVEAIY